MSTLTSHIVIELWGQLYLAALVYEWHSIRKGFINITKFPEHKWKIQPKLYTFKFH